MSCLDNYRCYCIFISWVTSILLKGTRCEQNTDDCVGVSCKNGWTCIDKLDAYECKCHPRFDGLHYGSNYDECASQPCRNRGTCTRVWKGILGIRDLTKYVAETGNDRYLHGSRGLTAPLEFKVSIYKGLIYALHLLSFVEIRHFNVFFCEKKDLILDNDEKRRENAGSGPPPLPFQYNTIH